VKPIRLKDFLTPVEIRKAANLYLECQEASAGAPFAVLCEQEIIRPVIDRINTALDQENDPAYLAYCVEYAMMHG
jgi:hypothetical protein